MAKFTLNGYNSYSGCDIVVTARLNVITGAKKELKEKIYSLGSLQTLSVSTHQDKKPVRVIGSANALDYTMGQRTIAGSLVFAVFDQHFATEMFNDLTNSTGKTFLLPDELPALDLTITFANEYGRESRMAIYGVRIINEGQVMSINDLYTENTYQFVANALEPLRKGIEAGASSSRNKTLTITSSIDSSDNSSDVNGEEIYNRIIIDSINESTRVNLVASVEQPTYVNQKGIVRLYLSPSQSVGTITILDKKSYKVVNEIQITNNIKQYSLELDASNYEAWYHNNEQILSNTVSFVINSIVSFEYSYNDTPIIETVTHNSIAAMSNNPSHNIGVCIDNITSKTIECEISSRQFKFENLNPISKYVIYTKNDSNISRPIEVTTLEKKDQLLDTFKDYVNTNKNLLSKEISEYQELLDKLDNDFLYALTKEKSIEAKELIYMAIKYKNELTTIMNNSNIKDMPVKRIDNIFGNTFDFTSGVSKANIFINKNKKDYFESSEKYPTEITYIGKANSLYNVISINDNFIKSPKYTFYAYSDNDKSHIEKQFGNVNVLNCLDIKPRINNKLSNISLQCLTALEHKTKDINLLKAPAGFINESLDLIVNIDYKDILGKKNSSYYLCISKLEECLDSTPFRKIEIDTNYEITVIDKLSTAINHDDIFAIWIEDENFNVISDLGFVSSLEDVNDLNNYIIENNIVTIIKKIETNLNKPGSLSDIVSTINNDNANIKDIYKHLAISIINTKNDNKSEYIYELFKNKFSEMYVVKEKYKEAVYDKSSNTIEFKNVQDVELVQIAIKKDDYNVEVLDNNKAIINSNYDINIFYLISSNPIIKSGFVMIDNKKALSHLINLEVI